MSIGHGAVDVQDAGPTTGIPLTIFKRPENQEHILAILGKM
jgi:hypothetical protein